MAITEREGLPIAILLESASPHESQLVEATLDELVVKSPATLIGDKAYDSGPLQTRLAIERRVLLKAPKRKKRGAATARPPPKGYKSRWKVERFFAWLQNFRRVVTRWEYYAENFLGFVHLACVFIILKRF
jgi:transposase